MIAALRKRFAPSDQALASAITGGRMRVLSGWARGAEDTALPTRQAGPMPWVIAIMVALCVVSAAAGLAMRRIADAARADLAGGVTIQILEARPEVVATRPDLVLDFPPNRQDRRTLPNGTEYFGASGTVTNVGKERRPVPAIRIVLRDSGNRIVYSWEVSVPKKVLAPGESVSVNEAVTDVPKTARYAEIGWKPE